MDGITRPEYYLGGICWIGTWTLISITICVISYYQLCRNDLESITTVYRNLTLISISTLTICGIGDLSHVIIRFIDFPNEIVYLTNELLLLTANDAVYFIGNTMFYILLLSRIYQAFQLNKCVALFLSLVIIISIFASVAYCIIIVYYNVTGGAVDFAKHLKYAVFPLSITDGILNSSLFVIFVYQMRKTIVNVDAKMVIYQNLSNVLSKHIVLFSVAIFSNQIYFAFLLYCSYTIPLTSFNPENVVPLLIIAYMIRVCAATINIIVLWLVININYDKYIRFCKCCHLCVSILCTKKNEKPLQNPYKKSLN